MIEPEKPGLSIVRQCELLAISRSFCYYQPLGENAESLALMRLMDEAYMVCPYYGARQMKRHLQRLGHKVGRHRIARLMRKNGSGSDLPEAQHQQAEQGTQGLSVSSQGLGHHPAQSVLVHRHNVYSGAPT